ncbi:protein BUD31 [Ramicandelaber brevisporus]|nr:protein BUD31 [Ramicandelaber brevisporus]
MSLKQKQLALALASKRSASAPDGWDDIEPTLLEFEDRLREATTASTDGLRKSESTWPILRLHHQRSRYLFDLYYKRQLISRELFDYCIDAKQLGDRMLIAKWRKSGYERLCCMRCVQSSETAFGTTCICRVPRRDLEPGKVVECVHCGCRGCSSSD